MPYAANHPFLPALRLPAGFKTRSASACWRDSTTREIHWQPMPKKAAVRLWHRARDFERRTREPGRQNGALGRNGLAVLHALIFDFFNFKTGQLDPAIATIASKACISPRSASRGLAALKLAGVLNWLRRCTARFESGRCVLDQESNAYSIFPPPQWRGYRIDSDPPAPEPGTWGDHPPLPDTLTAAVQAFDGGMRSVLRELETDPDNQLAAALARLGRTLEAASIVDIPVLPA